MNHLVDNIQAATTFPIVDKLATMAKDTATMLGTTLVIAIGIVIAIGLIWSHVSDRESGKWWKALAVWVMGAAVIAGIAGLYTWVTTNVTI
jgi:hypothetical protein